MSFLDWLFGAAKPQVIPATPLKEYPTAEDAAAARLAGYGYGDPNAAYIEGLAGKAFGGFAQGEKVDPFVPGKPRGKLSGIWDFPATDVMGKSGVSSGVQQQLQDAFTQAQLASNYLPVAALGLDPRVATADVSGREMTIGGAYSPVKDQLWFMANDPSVLLHEATHRGLKQVRDSGRVEMPTGDREEMLVRQLMESFAGDPEQAPLDIEQKKRAKINPFSEKDIAVLNKIVAEMVKERRPRGPR